MAEANPNARLEAFCDAVFAIALTLLIIDIRLPSADSIGSTAEFWRALRHLAPAIYAFLLSFGIIVITWVNHNATLRLVSKSAAAFVYANAFLLLTVVFIPFPTSLLGDFLGTDRAAPAVVLYDAVLAVQGFGWILVAHSALKYQLVKEDERSASLMREDNRNAYGALVLYSLLAVIAFWYPMTIAIVTTVTMVFWITVGIRLKGKTKDVAS